MKRKLIAFLLTSALTASSALAGHIQPIQGRSWPIDELDAGKLIEKTIGVMQKNGSLDKLINQWRKQTIDKIIHPTPIAGISLATSNSVRMFDPSYTYKKDVHDAMGNIVVRKGSKFNPLDYRPLTKSIVFLDGREKKHQELAAKMLDDDPSTIVVLTAGSWIELQNKIRHRIYYDQEAMLSKYFKITKTPTIITQEGRQLKIEERANDSL